MNSKWLSLFNVFEMIHYINETFKDIFKAFWINLQILSLKK